MDKNESSKPPTLGEALRELGRQFKVGFSEALAAAKAERVVKTGVPPVPGPESRLTAEEKAKLERLLQSWPSNGPEDAQA